MAVRYGEHPAVAYALPWSIDGLMVVATAAMIEDQRNNRRPRWSARVAFVFGVVASLGANIASAHPSWTARIVAAVPAVALLLAIEVLTRSGNAASPPATAHSENLDVPGEPDAPVPVVPEPTADVVTLPLGGLGETPEQPSNVKRRRPAAETKRLAEQLATDDPSLTKEQIAERLNISVRRLRVVLNAA